MKALLKRLLPDTHPVRLTYHRTKNQLIALRAGYPAKKLTVIAVTGTDGKTTTVAMIAHILEKTGIKAGAVSTAFFQIGAERKPNPTQKTSVDAGALQTFLRTLVNSGCTHVVIEASSHGLLQGRLSGITPSIAAITNMSMEHLDYHGTMEEYMKAKALLFRALRGRGTKVLHRDDPTCAAFSAIPSTKTFLYSPKNQLSDIRSEKDRVSATLSTGEGTAALQMHLPGAFNLENALCAITVAQALGIGAERAAEALEDFQGAGGRMERVDSGQPFHVFIDFTVTPAAYERTLASARNIAAGHRLLVLTGSCGDRMREKRPLVGELCGLMADVIVVTNEDPYTEDPEKIIDDVLAGVPKNIPIVRSAEEAVHAGPKYCVRRSDRLEAIRFLLHTAEPGDVVLLCGKGADVTMMTKAGQISWNEREIVTEELRSMNEEL